MIITLISDTHSLHEQINVFLPGGHLLLHGGDITNVGFFNEVRSFCGWYNDKKEYLHKIFIAGNHDKSFEYTPNEVGEIVKEYENITYLQDEELILDVDGVKVKLYGSPWQPEFYNWAFNLPRSGPGLSSKWEDIPDNTDILITHCPPQTILDTSGPPYRQPLLGCELLFDRVKLVKPKIHIFGHIHGGYGYQFDGETHFINASVLNEEYTFTNKPLTIDWDPITNKIEFL
jgi:hypothetical protein